MKRVIAVFVILASILSLAACKELTPEERMSSVAAEESRIAVERSSKEAAIEEGKRDILEEIGKTKKDKQVVAIRPGENTTEYHVVIFDKNGYADHVDKYKFYSPDFYRIHKDQKDFGSLDSFVERDDDLRMIKLRGEYEKENAITFEYVYNRYNKEPWTIVE